MCQKGRGGGAVGHAVDGDPGVERDHLRTRDMARQLLEDRARLGREGVAVEQHRLIRGEMVQIVDQHPQTMLLDLCVGGIEIGGGDGTRVERAIGHVVIEPHHFLVEPVAIPQRLPAVLTIEELVRQAEHQLRVGGQLRQGSNPEVRGLLLAHADGVGVVEPERLGHAHALLGQGRLEIGDRTVAEDLLAQRAGVLGVGVDLTSHERVPHEPGPAELAPMLGRDAAAGEELGGDLRRRSPTR